MKVRGFTLIEMIIVLAVFSILLSLALPDAGQTIVRTQVRESVDLIEGLKPNIISFYTLTGDFPKNNHTATIPDADKILGNYVSEVTLKNGAFHIRFGNKIRNSLHGKQLSIRPIYVENSPASPVSWICGYDTIPDGMLAAGVNNTNIEKIYLPLSCL